MTRYQALRFLTRFQALRLVSRSEASRFKFQGLMAPKKVLKLPKKASVLKRRNKRQRKFVSLYRNVYQCSRGSRLETRFIMGSNKYHALADTEDELLAFMRSKGRFIVVCMCAYMFDF